MDRGWCQRDRGRSLLWGGLEKQKQLERQLGLTVEQRVFLTSDAFQRHRIRRLFVVSLAAEYACRRIFPVALGPR